jgi:magnesium transporter
MSENHNESEADAVKDDLAEVQNLLAKHRLVEEVSRRQDSGRHDVVESLVSRQHIVELRHMFARLPTVTVALVLSALPEEDRLVAWKEIAEERIDSILELLSEEICEDLVGDGHRTSTKVMVNAFELHNGRLRQITVDRPAQLTNIKPIWVDLVAPTPRVREWVGKYFNLEVPDPEDLTDLEASARFYIEDNGEVHLHSDFLLDLEEASRNVAVAFILHKDILFSVRTEELPVFRLQRLRARTQPGYVTDGTDVLLDLYAADAEYSADRLEDVYAELEDVGKKVLNTKLTDDEAGNILADIARQEDLNGRIRRNVLDTRRALSFLMRGKFLTSNQIEDARQIMRDIESLDGHTSFLFGKINFLMDTTVGFININQNKIVKLFSVVSVGLLPPTLIASVYGMNFQHMPELQWEYGYPFSLALMLASVTAPFWYFRQKGWLS